MGLTKFIISIWILFNDEPFTSSFFKTNPILHFAVTVAITFSFLETGFVTGKQMKIGIYPNLSDLLISRFFRIYSPGLIVIVASLLLMGNSLVYIKHNMNLFEVLQTMAQVDKIVFYASHFTLLLQPWLFFGFDNTENTFTYQLGMRDHIPPMLSTSVAPHMWTIMSDILGVLAIGYFFFNKKFIHGIVSIVILFIFQIIIINALKVHDLDVMAIWQNPLALVLHMSCGFVCGYKSNSELKFGMNKYTSAMAGWTLIAASIYMAALFANNSEWCVIANTLTIPAFMIGCDLLWPLFAFKKWDMKIRNMNSHLYFWHFLFLSLIYERVNPSIYSCIFSVTSIITFSIFFGPWFEEKNKKIINYFRRLASDPIKDSN